GPAGGGSSISKRSSPSPDRFPRFAQESTGAGPAWPCSSGFFEEAKGLEGGFRRQHPAVADLPMEDSEGGDGQRADGGLPGTRRPTGVADLATVLRPTRSGHHAEVGWRSH